MKKYVVVFLLAIVSVGAMEHNKKSLTKRFVQWGQEKGAQALAAYEKKQRKKTAKLVAQQLQKSYVYQDDEDKEEPCDQVVIMQQVERTPYDYGTFPDTSWKTVEVNLLDHGKRWK